MRIATVEHERNWSLEVVELFDEDNCSVAVVPIVNRWIQLSVEVTRLPSPDESRLFFDRLLVLTTALRSSDALESWFFLHKPPGLILRFLFSQPTHALPALIAAFQDWDQAWMGGMGFDSYFEHRELLAGAFPHDTARLLCTGAETWCHALAVGRQGTVAEWADLTVTMLERFLGDRWLVWEALGRFQQMRASEWRPGPTPERVHPLLSPVGLLDRLLGDAGTAPTPGFVASSAMLQCLNYLYNQWLLDAPLQREVLAAARSACAPEISR